MGDQSKTTNRWAAEYPSDYSAQVSRALFGLPHDPFIRGKATWLRQWLARHGREAGDVLDIGCGIGLLHRYLPGRVTGCDVSEEALRQAAERNHGAEYHLHDGRSLPFPDASFDHAMAVTVMHHVPPVEWPAFVTEAVRVLRPGGAFIVIEHNPWNPATRLSVALSPIDTDAVLLSARQTRRLLAELQRVGSDSLFLTAQYAAYGFKPSHHRSY